MVRGGARIGVLGVNGAGKSTLIKTLAGLLEPLSGERLASRGLEIGYFAQHQLDMLDAGSTPLQHLARLAPQAREQELRNYLGGFAFSGDAATSPVAPMSGGEKARLALALIVWQKPNLLLLDEPSNHLDVDTREALATALAEFPGSVLLVSHDRHLLRTTVDNFWIVADGRVQAFDGDLDDYRDWLAARGAAARAQARQQSGGNSAAGEEDTPADAGAALDRKQQRRLQAEARQRQAALRKPLETRLARIESDMNADRARLAELDGLIADASLYTDERRAERQQVMTEHGELSKRMSELEDQWLEVQEALEEIAQA
jgi:ATP-binding cassette subfamily F protein 3